MPRICASRRDDNESGIVKALQQVGASVYRIDAGGIPDLLVGFRRQMFLLEVKAPRGPRGGGGGKLTKKQIEFRRDWRGPVPIIVRTQAEALTAIGVRFAFDPPPYAYDPITGGNTRNR